jgi:hypothetical protein
VESSRTAAAGIQKSYSLRGFQVIAVGMPVYDQVIRGQIRGEVFLFMCDINVKAEQGDVQKEWEMLSPVFIVVSPDNIYRRDLIKRINDFLTVDITSVEDGIAAFKYLKNLITK